MVKKKQSGVKATRGGEENLHEKMQVAYEEHKSHLSFRFIMILVMAVLVCACGIVVFMSYKKFSKPEVTTNYMAVYSQILQVAELTAIKNNYSDVVCVKKSVAGGLSKAYSIVKFSGVIRAGIKDTGAITFAVSPDGKTVTVKVPHSEVLGNGLISQEVFDEKKGLFVSITTQEILAEIEEGMKRSQENFVNADLLREADIQVKHVITSLLVACGFTEVNVERV